MINEIKGNIIIKPNSYICRCVDYSREQMHKDERLARINYFQKNNAKQIKTDLINRQFLAQYKEYGVLYDDTCRTVQRYKLKGMPQQLIIKDSTVRIALLYIMRESSGIEKMNIDFDDLKKNIHVIRVRAQENHQENVYFLFCLGQIMLDKNWDIIVSCIEYEFNYTDINCYIVYGIKTDSDM